MINEELEASTYKKCFRKFSGQRACLLEEIAYLRQSSEDRLKDKYYLFYSANHFENIDYSVGYAVSDSPFGPWAKQKDSPILHRSIVDENGSGHGDFFEGLDGQLYYVYHVHFNEQQVGPRRTRIVPVTKQWDSKTSLYKFKVKRNEVIVPVVAEK